MNRLAASIVFMLLFPVLFPAILVGITFQLVYRGFVVGCELGEELLVWAASDGGSAQDKKPTP